MGWNTQDAAAAGNWIRCDVSGGWNLDLFSTTTETEIAERVQSGADGWTVQNVVWNRGLFGVGEKFRIFGRATSDVATSAIQAQTEAALDSFWFIGGASVDVTVSNDASMPDDTPTPADSIRDALKWGAIAVIVIAGLWLAIQIKREVD